MGPGPSNLYGYDENPDYTGPKYAELPIMDLSTHPPHYNVFSFHGRAGQGTGQDQRRIEYLSITAIYKGPCEDAPMNTH